MENPLWKAARYVALSRLKGKAADRHGAKEKAGLTKESSLIFSK
jgi:hypothetical protein